MKIWTHRHGGRRRGPANPVVDAPTGVVQVVGGRFRLGARDVKDEIAYWIELTTEEVERLDNAREALARGATFDALGHERPAS